MTWLTWLQGTCAYQPFKANLPFVWSNSRLLFQKIFFFEKISHEGFFNCYSGQEYFLVLLRVSKSGFLGDWSKKWDHPSRWLWLGLMSLDPPIVLQGILLHLTEIVEVSSSSKVLVPIFEPKVFLKLYCYIYNQKEKRPECRLLFWFKQILPLTWIWPLSFQNW